jgi:ArsR family metal-binding transcriptional regulator
LIDDNVKKVPQPVYGVRLEPARGKSLKILWESLPENKEKEAVRYLINQFKADEEIDLNNLKGKVILTGLKHLELSKKESKEFKSVVIRAVSRNNDVSDPVTFHL